MFRRKPTSIHPELNRAAAKRARTFNVGMLKVAAIAVGSLLVIGGTWAVAEMSASTPDPAKLRMAELKGRSVAHTFIIDAYEQCMAPKDANRYRCLKSTADAAKTKTMTSFQIIGVFKDYGININGSDFPEI
ncbi:hypothetical protein [Pseudomonas serbica]|jgi:hypothetical protein|uniref:hypothetical protein n=1 Tax=Pseudomonas serbica TaxID=2965074 RepID=UPI00237A1DE7|nr:hypothetical protein [Pseudomonas serbica]